MVVPSPPLPSVALAAAMASAWARGGGGESAIREAMLPDAAATTALRGGAAGASLYERFHAQAPESVRFLCCSNTGTVVLYVLDRIVFAAIATKTLPHPFLERNKASVSYFLAYFLSVVPQHWLLAFFVYGLQTISTREKYARTLLGTYQT